MDTLLSFKRKGSRPTEADILSLFRSEVESYDRVFIIFDALDEVPEQHRTYIIRRLLADLPSNASMILTFRDIPAITDLFSQVEGARRLQIAANNEDIRTYVASVIQWHPRLPKLVQLPPCPGIESIISKVIEKSDGMFLMACLIMDQLSAQTTSKALTAALDRIPSTIDQMYDQTLDRCPNREKALRLLSWVFMIEAEVQLTPSHLQCAASWEVDATEPLNAGSLEDVETVLSSCAGLLRLQRVGNGRIAVTFTHYTMREYLAKLVPGSHAGLLTHADLALICLTYIHHHSTLYDLGQSPFLEYCASCWYKHSLRCPEPRLVKQAARIVLTSTDDIKYLSLLDWDLKVMLGIHYACKLGLYHILEDLCEGDPRMVNAKSLRGDTPLHIAAFHGHLPVVRSLLSIDGVQANLHDGSGLTPIMVAAVNGHLPIVKCMLAHSNVDAAKMSLSGLTVLHYAVLNDHANIVAYLVTEAGVDVNMVAEWKGNTPLHIVHTKEVAEVLLAYEGVDPNAQNSMGQTPLHSAMESWSSRTHVAPLLIACPRVDVNATDSQLRTAFMEAASLDNDDCGLTPLFLAREDLDIQLCMRAYEVILSTPPKIVHVFDGRSRHVPSVIGWGGSHPDKSWFLGLLAKRPRLSTGKATIQLRDSVELRDLVMSRAHSTRSSSTV